MVNFQKDLRFQNDKSSKWLCSFRLVPFIQLCIQPCDGFEAREDLFRSCHEIVQVEPTGGAIAKFFKGGVVSVGTDFVLLRFEDHVAQPGFSSIVHALVVAQDLVDLIAVVALGSENSLST